MMEVEKITPSNYLGLDANQLTELYLVEKLSSTQIAELCKCHPSTILSYLKKVGTKIRSQSEQKKLYPNPNLKHNVPHTLETRKKISEIEKTKYASGEKVPWNKGRKGKYLGDSRKERLTNHDYNPQEIRKTTKVLIEKYASGGLTINRQPPKQHQVKIKIIKKMGRTPGFKHTEEFKAKISAILKRLHASGNVFPRKKVVKICTNCNEYKQYGSKDLCYSCYRRHKIPGRLMTCPNCKQERKYFAKGLCEMCYQKMQRIGKSYDLNNQTIKEIENKFQQPIRLVLEDFLMEGLTTKEIAKQCEVCVQTVLKWLRVVNLPVKTRTEAINHAFKKNGTIWAHFTPEQKEAHIKKFLNSMTMRPTKPEKQVMGIIERNKLPYRYVGDGKVFIEGRIPDFINVNGQKKIVEVFGNYWHKEMKNLPFSKTFQGTIDFYKKYGYETLIIWEDNLKKDIIREEQRIINFDRGEKAW